MNTEDLSKKIADPYVSQKESNLSDETNYQEHSLFNVSLGPQTAKAEILLSAMKVFVNKGLGGTTVQDLLDEADVSRRTFYKYFKNKYDVLENLYKLSIDLLIASYRKEIEKAASLAELVEGVVDVYFGHHAEFGPLIRLMHEEAMRSESPLAKHRENAHRVIVDIFDVEIKKHQGRGFDPWAYYSINWMVEQASMHLITHTACTREEVERCKKVMHGIVGSILVIGGDRPTVPEAPEFASSIF